MGIFDNFKNLLNVSPDEDDDIGAQVEPEEEIEEERDIFSKKREASSRPAYTERTEKRNKVVSYNATPSQMQVVLVKPERYEEVKDIADHLNNKKTVVLNLEITNKENARRIIDFLSGVAYANRGTVKKIANSTFLIAPANVDFAGEMLIDEFEDSKIYF
ncbi:MAG: cell division protein SepF [Clostridia bacterium]|nr:cell division protein SepF [Clostridia bacterium]